MRDKKSLRHSGGISLPVVGIIVVVALVVLAVVYFFVNNKKSSENVTTEQPSVSASPTQATSIGGAADDTRAVVGFTDQYQTVRKQTITLIETYYRLEPTDTTDTRQQRIEALGYPADALQELTYYVGTLTCGDQARLNQSNPLTQQAFVTSSDIDVRPSDEQVPFTYVTAQFVVVQVQANGDPFPGSIDCPSAAQMSATASWQQEANGTWTLLNFSAPEAPL